MARGIASQTLLVITAAPTIGAQLTSTMCFVTVKYWPVSASTGMTGTASIPLVFNWIRTSVQESVTGL